MCLYDLSVYMNVQNEDCCIIYLHSYQQLVETRTAADTKDLAAVLVSSRC
jgi:hypothetical protein